MERHLLPFGTVVAIYNGLLFALVAWAILLMWGSRRPPHSAVRALVLGSLIIGVIGLAGAAFSPIEHGLSRFQLVTWLIFFHFPLFLVSGSLILRRHRQSIAIGCAVLGGLILAIGVDAFLIEPHWLKVTHLRIATSKVDRPVRIALLADIQTDAPGPYEQKVLTRVMAERPDLILLAGDYIQVDGPDRYTHTLATLNAVFRQAQLAAPLGIYAVQGNIDMPSWKEIFAGLPITCIENHMPLDLGPVVLTGLSSGESSQSNCQVAAQDKFHIVLGHCPNFSLGQVDGDLLLAGHTHGGQVRLPGIGPLLTFSKVPRSWASGRTEIGPVGKVGTRTLVVSRGLGLERYDAPRIRFLCRPELVILDLTPDPQTGG